MFEAKLADGSILKKIIESIKDLVSEANFECSSTGISVQAMDISHVSLISLELSAELFFEYRCDRNIVLGVNISDMNKILRCASATDSISLKCQDDGDTLTFVFKSTDGERISTFSSKLMNIDAESLSIQDQEGGTTVTFPSPQFAEIVRHISQFSDSMIISTTKESINFKAKDNIINGDINIISNDEIENSTVKIDCKDRCNQKFSVKFLIMFSKSHGLSNTVKLRLQNDFPICVQFDIEPKSYLKFFLAPSVNDDEDDEDVKK